MEFIGEIGEEEKNDFLGNALALLFPIDWPETFWPGHDRILRDRNPGHRFCQWFGAGNYRTRADGLYRGESGRGLLRGRQNLLDQPAEVPGEFEARFGVGRMAREYVALYEKLLADREKESGDDFRLIRSAA